MSIEKFGIDLRRSMKVSKSGDFVSEKWRTAPRTSHDVGSARDGCFFLVLVFLTILGAIH